MGKVQPLSEAQEEDMKHHLDVVVWLTGTSDEVGEALDAMEAIGAAEVFGVEGWTKTFYGWERDIWGTS